MSRGRVEGIFIGPPGELPGPVERVDAVAGRGLEGNRYFLDEPEPGRALTLIQAEALEDLERDTGIRLSAAESRRNVLTRGIDLNALVGKRFRVGEAECYGVELCEPCLRLQSLTRPGIIDELTHRAGINADILTSGTIAGGDSVLVPS